MAKTYEQIAKQIEVLKQQAEVLKRKESAGVIARIKQAIEFYQLTAADLGLGGGAKTAAPKATTTAAAPAKRATGARKKTGKRPSVIRYRDVSGKTWTGMGRKPGWLIDGLAAGKTLADFAITPPAGSDGPI